MIIYVANATIIKEDKGMAYTEYKFVDFDTDTNTMIPDGGTIKKTTSQYSPYETITITKNVTGNFPYGAIVKFTIPDGYNIVGVSSNNYQPDENDLGTTWLAARGVIGSIIRVEGNTVWVRVNLFVWTTTSFALYSLLGDAKVPHYPVRLLVAK